MNNLTDNDSKMAKPGANIARDENKLQTRIQHGPFTIYPGFGTVQPGQNTQITVDFGVESVQKYEEFLAIEISDRNPDDCPGGIAYKLLAEGCLPTIDTVDLHGIFEEHRVVRSITEFQNIAGIQVEGGIYGVEESKFVFPNVVVGRKATARFKISNPHKLSCDVNFTVKARVRKKTIVFDDY